MFRHPGGHECLPEEIAQHVNVWKRPNEIFGFDGISVQSKDDRNDLQNLLVVNEPLMHVKVITAAFRSQLHILNCEAFCLIIILRRRCVYTINFSGSE